MRWIIEADKPFPGHVQSVMRKDNTVGYTDGQTLEEYEAEKGCKLQVIDDDQLDKLIAEYEDGMKTNPKQITKDKYWYALEVLPPARWHMTGGFEVFHVSEHITGSLVNWYAERAGKYYTFIDSCSLTDEAIAAKLAVGAKEDV